MLRLSEIKLPLNHTPEELPAAILKKLGVPASDLLLGSRNALGARA